MRRIGNEKWKKRTKLLGDFTDNQLVNYVKRVRRQERNTALRTEPTLIITYELIGAMGQYRCKWTKEVAFALTGGKLRRGWKHRASGKRILRSVVVDCLGEEYAQSMDMVQDATQARHAELDSEFAAILKGK